MKKCSTCLHGPEPFCTWRSLMTTVPTCRVICEVIPVAIVWTWPE